MRRYMCVYDGPGGPISHEVTTESLTDAVDVCREHGKEWYDRACNALGLSEGASRIDVADALARGGYRRVYGCFEESGVTGIWDVYEEVRP